MQGEGSHNSDRTTFNSHLRQNATFAAQTPLCSILE